MEKLLKIEEVADMLGYKIASIYQLVFRKEIPAIKITGRALRFKASDIEAWLEEKTQPVKNACHKPPVRRIQGIRKKGFGGSIDDIIEQTKREVSNG